MEELIEVYEKLKKQGVGNFKIENDPGAVYWNDSKGLFFNFGHAQNFDKENKYNVRPIRRF